MRSVTRRYLLELMGAGAALAAFPSLGATVTAPDTGRSIPGMGESMPRIGMGTWRTFNVGGDPELRDARTRVLAAFFEEGGGLIDSSPMYGSSQSVLGYGLEKLGYPDSLYAADKIWTRDGDATRDQAAESAATGGPEPGTSDEDTEAESESDAGSADASKHVASCDVSIGFLRHAFTVCPGLLGNTTRDDDRRG